MHTMSELQSETSDYLASYPRLMLDNYLSRCLTNGPATISEYKGHGRQERETHAGAKAQTWSPTQV